MDKKEENEKEDERPPPNSLDISHRSDPSGMERDHDDGSQEPHRDQGHEITEGRMSFQQNLRENKCNKRINFVFHVFSGLILFTRCIIDG